MQAAAVSLLAASEAIFDASARAMDLFLLFALVVFLVALVLEVIARNVVGALLAGGLALTALGLMFTT